MKVKNYAHGLEAISTVVENIDGRFVAKVVAETVPESINQRRLSLSLK